MTSAAGLRALSMLATALLYSAQPPAAGTGLAVVPGFGRGADDLGIQASFGTWVVGCDNARSCRAIGVPVDRHVDETALILDRTGQPAARPVFRLVLARPEGSTGALAGKLQLASDGSLLPMLEVGRNLQADDPFADTWRASIVDESVVSALVLALRTGKALTVARPGAAPFATISLEGAAAALLFADERQQRVGTTGALVAVGSRHDAEIPAPPPLPRAPAITPLARLSAKAALPAAVRRLYEADVAAEHCSEEVAASAERVVARLGPQRVLFAIPCWMGAYQGGNAYYRHHTDAPEWAEPLKLPRPHQQRVEDDHPGLPGHILGGDEFDPASGEISTFAKGRGRGDCGTTASWVWAGRAFVLTSFSDLPICRGLDHDDWLSLYRTAAAAE